MANRIVMAYWDCPSCGTKGNRGDQASCPNCGRARGEVKFYMRDHAEGQTLEEDERGSVEYVDEEKAKYINRSPDWYCSFCQSLNSDNAENCTSCGASRASSEANYFQMHSQLQQREAERQQPVQPETPQKKRSFLPLILIAAVIIGVVMYLNSSRTRGDFQVSGLSWARSIVVEQNQMFQESGWNAPAGAEITAQKQELHHYDSVLDHYENVPVQRSREVIDHYETYYSYEDLGNGYFEEVPHERAVYKTEYYTEVVSQPVYRQEPNYQTKYYYNIWRWTAVREENASGEGHDAAWPEISLGENEREGTRTEIYRVVIRNTKKDTTATYRMKEEDWRQLNTGDSLYITDRRSGADAYISDEKGERLMDLYPNR